MSKTEVQKDQTKTSRRKKGEGSVYYNEKKGLWNVQITYKLPNGKSIKKSFSGKTFKDANEKKELFFKENLINPVDYTSEATIPFLLKEFIEYQYSNYLLGDSGYTRKMHSYNIIKSSNVGNIPVQMITDDDIKDFLSSITHYSDSVIGKVFSLLKKGFDLAIEQKIITFNPLMKSTIVKPKSKKQTKKVYAYTYDEQTVLEDAIKNYCPPNNRNNYKLQWLLELYTGMRMGEINALTINDINFTRNEIYISKTVTRDKHYHNVIGEKTKTSAGNRTIPMNSMAKVVLNEAVKNFNDNDKNLLFYDSINDKIIGTGPTNLSFRRLCEQKGIPFYGQHSLRHTFATRCIESGISAEVLKSWLGHTDISTTINTYCDVFAKMHNNAITMLEQYLNPKY